MKRCTTAEQIERWLQQPGDDAEAQALAAHADGRPRCQQALEGLKGTPAAPGRHPAWDPAPAVLETAASPRHAAAPRSRLDQETRLLLRRRLRAFSLVVAA